MNHCRRNTIMQNTDWTPDSTRTALALASTFGHGWADVAVLREDGSLDLDATEAAQVAHERNMPCGGLRPSLSHRTTSGRLSWEVRPDGACLLEVTRPLTALTPFAAGLDGHVVVAIATLHRVEASASHWMRPAEWGALKDGLAAPPVEIGGWLVTVDSVPELFEERHSRALGDALLAVLGRHDLAPTRTRPLLRLDTWRESAFLEIDEHEFFLRDLTFDASGPGLVVPVPQGGKA
jgi:hypothetical protein